MSQILLRPKLMGEGHEQFCRMQEFILTPSKYYFLIKWNGDEVILAYNGVAGGLYYWQRILEVK